MRGLAYLRSGRDAAHGKEFRMRDRAGISWAAAAATSLALLVAAAPAFGSTAVSADFSYSPALPAPGQPVTFTSTSQGARLQGWDLDGDGRLYDSFDTTA